MAVESPTHPRPSTPPTVYAVMAVLFLAFLAYYVFTAWYLPRGAGPDSGAHYDVAKFIFENGRLAVIPDDEDQLKFTPYGSTRALRPPLSYLVSAAVAGLVEPVAHDSLFINLRFGSGLLCAAAAAFLFLGLWLLFRRLWVALSGALLFGLLPQLTFIASYVNDDSGAIFSGTLLTFAMALVAARGLGAGTAAVFGLATGLVLLSKFTAWLLLPWAAGFLVPHLWRAARKGVTHAGLIVIAAMLFGGWWILFNMYHYGVDDPVLSGVSARVSEQRAVISDAGHRGYLSRGVGLTDLVLHNYKNFLGESFKSTVGHLDWLRIRLGWPQYLLYAIVFSIGVAYVPARKLRQWIGLSSHYDPEEPSGADWLYGVLLLMVVFQVVMYVRFNLHHDVQIQGKYLLPALAPMLILFSAAAVAIRGHLSARTPKCMPGPLWVALWLALVVGSHLHALRTYVIPYYYPDPLVYRMSPFRYLDLTDLDFVERSDDVNLEPGRSGLAVESLGIDPRIQLKGRYCRWMPVNVLIHVVLESEQKGDFKVYVDPGDGFSEQVVVGARYGSGENHLIMPMGVTGCRAIRLDPASAPGRVLLRRVGIAPIHISR